VFTYCVGLGGPIVACVFLSPLEDDFCLSGRVVAAEFNPGSSRLKPDFSRVTRFNATRPEGAPDPAFFVIGRDLQTLDNVPS